jgi:hypothetical protein
MEKPAPIRRSAWITSARRPIDVAAWSGIEVAVTLRLTQRVCPFSRLLVGQAGRGREPRCLLGWVWEHLLGWSRETGNAGSAFSVKMRSVAKRHAVTPKLTIVGMT